MMDLKTWEAWHTVHQPFEINWWRDALSKGHSKDDVSFKIKWDEIRDFIAPVGSILDIGCGPRPPFAPCTVIEPLASQYKLITPASWWEGVTVYEQPAEVSIGQVKFDTIICWNCLDHAVGWCDILDRMCDYRPDKVAIATDFHEPFDGHPGFSRDEFMHEIDKRFLIYQLRENFCRDLALCLWTK